MTAAAAAAAVLMVAAVVVLMVAVVVLPMLAAAAAVLPTAKRVQLRKTIQRAVVQPDTIASRQLQARVLVSKAAQRQVPFVKATRGLEHPPALFKSLTRRISPSATPVAPFVVTQQDRFPDALVVLVTVPAQELGAA